MQMIAPIASRDPNETKNRSPFRGWKTMFEWGLSNRTVKNSGDNKPEHRKISRSQSTSWLPETSDPTVCFFFCFFNKKNKKKNTSWHGKLIQRQKLGFEGWIPKCAGGLHFAVKSDSGCALGVGLLPFRT